MIKSLSNESVTVKNSLKLPSFTNELQSAFSKGESLQIDGTNVVRVPFGIRQPRKQKPQMPKRVATLILPFQPVGSPTPPQAA